MRHEPFPSLDELLAPTTLSQLAQALVSTVRRGPFTGGHSASGSSFLAVETNDGQGPRFVVKLSSPECDWIVRATADQRGREVLMWTTGLLDRLPPEIVHPVLACAHDGASWAILMRDLSHDLIPDPMGYAPISRADHRRYLDALAALHETFWDEPGAADPGDGYCAPRHRFTALSPETGEREAAHPNDVMIRIRDGWTLFWDSVTSDVAELVRRFFADPNPLCTALARYPHTIAHGNPRAANLGIARGSSPRVILLDWHLVGPGTPGVDLAWYLWAFGCQLPEPRETTIACYRGRLAHRLGSRLDEAWWRPQMDLSLLGQLMRGGFWLGFAAAREPDAAIRAWYRDEFAWWSARAREGTRWL